MDGLEFCSYLLIAFSALVMLWGMLSQSGVLRI